MNAKKYISKFLIAKDHDFLSVEVKFLKKKLESLRVDKKAIIEDQSDLGTLLPLCRDSASRSSALEKQQTSAVLLTTTADQC